MGGRGRRPCRHPAHGDARPTRPVHGLPRGSGGAGPRLPRGAGEEGGLMGYVLQIDEEEPVALASVVGWGDFSDWVYDQDPGAYPLLSHLVAYGWTGEVGDLRK